MSCRWIRNHDGVFQQGRKGEGVWGPGWPGPGRAVHSGEQKRPGFFLSLLSAPGSSSLTTVLLILEFDVIQSNVLFINICPCPTMKTKPSEQWFYEPVQVSVGYDEDICSGCHNEYHRPSGFSNRN